ncbi:hypothetical protein KW114_00825 [Methylococcus capsulatus]|nr:hypothetical protein KW114_00825 [Methylococcus capsulatus]
MAHDEKTSAIGRFRMSHKHPVEAVESLVMADRYGRPAGLRRGFEHPGDEADGRAPGDFDAARPDRLARLLRAAAAYAAGGGHPMQASPERGDAEIPESIRRLRQP